MLNFIELIYLMIAGALGTFCRYLLTFIYNKIPFTASISLINGISIVNILGSFLFALTYGYFLKNAIAQNLQIIVLTGFLGAFTTFSTLIFETRQLFIDNVFLALFYLLLQIIIAFIIVHFTLLYFDL